MISFFKKYKSVSLIIIILMIDSISKLMTHQYLPLRNWYALWYPYGGIGVFKNFGGIEFSIIHATNKGAAWGILANYQDQLLIFRIVLICGLFIYAFLINKNNRYTIPFAMIIAGATGNVIDFFIYGHVVDMLHFVLWGYDFPVFNIADTSIFLGVSSIFILSWMENKAPSKGKSIKSKS